LNSSKEKIHKLIKKGVKVLDPDSVMIGPEVVLDRIAGDGVVIYPGCRIFGRKSLIMAGAQLGDEGPVTIHECLIGPGVHLRGGVFKGSVFLAGASMGSAAQIRNGCLLEEHARSAHGVGLKQTILFPFVTLGSLINFCDCLMAGGTSQSNHSEVGSAYIHFNYTPNQDKATPSLIGDVPRGVMLNQPPIFLGGQGGLVGPARVEYGCVIAAGVICRRDLDTPNKVLLRDEILAEGEEMNRRVSDRYPGLYRHMRRRVMNNVIYIANLIALRHWYQRVRIEFVTGRAAEMLYQGALDTLKAMIAERITRFRALAEKMPESIRQYRALAGDQVDQRVLAQKKELLDRWPDVEAVFLRHMESEGDLAVLEAFMAGFEERLRGPGSDYLAVVQALPQDVSSLGIRWLQGIVDGVRADVLAVMPSYGT